MHERKGLILLCAGILLILHHVSTAEARRYHYYGSHHIKQKITPSPVVWAKSLEQAQEIASAEKPIYLFFSMKESGKPLPTLYRFNKRMQRISKEDAVFARVEISRKVTKEERELLKKYRVSKPGTAVLADQHGNYLTHAEKNSSKLDEQIRKVCKLIAHRQKLIDDRLEKGKAALEDGDRFTAKRHFKFLVDKFAGYKEAETAAGLLSKLKEEKAKEAAAAVN